MTRRGTPGQRRARARPVGRPRFRTGHPAPGPAGELPSGDGCAVEDPSDLVERHGEQIVQHECEPLGRCQRVKHDEQRTADGVGQYRVALRVAVGDVGAYLVVERHLCAGAARLQLREADACDDRSEPAAEVGDVAAVGAAGAQPGVLNRVVGLRRRTEQS